MSNVPYWMPLVGAVVGGVVVGVFGLLTTRMTQRSADRRESEAREAERDRERARWGREDEHRTFEERRTAYEAFYIAQREVVQLLWNSTKEAIRRGTSPDTNWPEDWDRAAETALYRLHMYATPEVDVAADALWSVLVSWEWELRSVDLDSAADAHEEYMEKHTELMSAMRTDLRVPDDWTNALG